MAIVLLACNWSSKPAPKFKACAIIVFASMNTYRIGVISDTHGLMRPEALEALRGSGLIIHAGDVGSPSILEELQELAPVAAVRGNIDTARWAQVLPEREVVEFAGVSLYLLHDLQELGLDPAAAGLHAVISGHSHRPSIHRRQGVLLLNPGSAGPRRFNLPVSVALLHVRDGTIVPQLIELKPALPRK